MVRASYIYTTARCGLLDWKVLFLLSKEAINYKLGWKFSTLNFNLTNLNMLLLIFKVGIQLRTPKSVIETHKIQKLDFSNVHLSNLGALTLSSRCDRLQKDLQSLERQNRVINFHVTPYIYLMPDFVLRCEEKLGYAYAVVQLKCTYHLSVFHCLLKHLCA